MLKRFMVGTALSGLLISGALAQTAQPMSPSANSPAATQSTTSNPSSPPKSANAGSAHFVASQQPDQWLASKFKGTDVIGDDNQKIGDVSDILFDKSGKVEAFVISVGGFLGMGSKDVALAPDSFQVVKGSNGSADKLKISLSKDQLKQAQNFEPYKPRTTTGMAPTGGPPTRPSSNAPPTGR